MPAGREQQQDKVQRCQAEPLPARHSVPDVAGARDDGQRFVFALGVADFLDHICP